MKTIFSDSMVSPRGIDAASVDYRYPLASTGNEGPNTRTRRDGYRSKPVRMVGRNIEIIGTMRAKQSSTAGALSIYVWKKISTIAYKNPHQVPAIPLVVIGNLLFGEQSIIPDSLSGASFRVPVSLDEDVDFIQIYTTMDVAAITINETDTEAARKTILLRPEPANAGLLIADDFELTVTNTTPILINDPFSIGQFTETAPVFDPPEAA